MLKLSKNGLSLIELLCAVIILFILIIMAYLSISRIIENSKENTKLALEKLIIKASESYIENNLDKAPKNINESTNISFKELRNNNYLKEDISNSNKESCMENSYVRVYKLNKTEYTYLPYLHCGKDKVNEEVISPTIKLLFIDDNDIKNSNSIFNNINESRIYLEITGGSTIYNTPIEINNYMISISMKTKKNTEYFECYNSGFIDANRKYTYVIDKKIMDYVNLKDATSISITVYASNTIGGVKEVTRVVESSINSRG